MNKRRLLAYSICYIILIGLILYFNRYKADTLINVSQHDTTNKTIDMDGYWLRSTSMELFAFEDIHLEISPDTPVVGEWTHCSIIIKSNPNCDQDPIYPSIKKKYKFNDILNHPCRMNVRYLRNIRDRYYPIDAPPPPMPQGLNQTYENPEVLIRRDNQPDTFDNVVLSFRYPSREISISYSVKFKYPGEYWVLLDGVAIASNPGGNPQSFDIPSSFKSPPNDMQFTFSARIGGFYVLPAEK